MRDARRGQSASQGARSRVRRSAVSPGTSASDHYGCGAILSGGGARRIRPPWDGHRAPVEREKSGIWTITTSPNFAAKWLVHRLGRFSEAHPGIDLRISASVQHVDFAREDIDLAIRHGDGQWPGMHVKRLCTEELFPVCNPKLLSGSGALRSPRDIKHHTLLHTNSTDDWANWLGRVGVDGADFKHGIVFN